MPRVRPLARPDPWESEIRAEIGAGMAAMRISQKELAKMAGIKPTTLSMRIGKKGDIGSMRLSELYAIRKVFRRGA